MSETTIVNAAKSLHRKFKDTNSWWVLLITLALSSTGTAFLKEQAGKVGLTHEHELADITNRLERIERAVNEQAPR